MQNYFYIEFFYILKYYKINSNRLRQFKFFCYFIYYHKYLNFYFLNLENYIVYKNNVPISIKKCYIVVA